MLASSQTKGGGEPTKNNSQSLRVVSLIASIERAASADSGNWIVQLPSNVATRKESFATTLYPLNDVEFHRDFGEQARLASSVTDYVCFQWRFIPCELDELSVKIFQINYLYFAHEFHQYKHKIIRFSLKKKTKFFYCFWQAKKLYLNT